MNFKQWLVSSVACAGLAIGCMGSVSIHRAIKAGNDVSNGLAMRAVVDDAAETQKINLDGGFCDPAKDRYYRWHTKVDYQNPMLEQKLERGVIDRKFLESLEKVCDNLDMHCMGLLSVMDFETGGSFKPGKKNMAGSNATGLIQFMPSTARYLGTSTYRLSKMSQTEQLEFVDKYFVKNAHRTTYDDPANIALTVFYPAAAGKPDWYVIGRKNSSSSKSAKRYALNRGLDKNDDGRVSAREYAAMALNRGFLIKSGI